MVSSEKRMSSSESANAAPVRFVPTSRPRYFITLFRRNQLRHPRFLMRGVFLVDDASLCGHIYCFVGFWEHLQSFVGLSRLHGFLDLRHHGFHIGFRRLPAILTDAGLAHALDGGLDDWHCWRSLGRDVPGVN